MIPASAIREVKQAAPLLPEVQGYVKLQKSGATSWTGLCPFHNEKTPSFTVHDRRDPVRPDYYRCFGCGCGGDVVTFVSAIQSISRGAAIRVLAEVHGVDITERKETRNGARYMRDLRAQADFWWARKRAGLLHSLEEACAEYFAAAERGESLQESGEWAECCGRLVRSVDALETAERERIFMTTGTDADLRQFREMVASRAAIENAITARGCL